MSRWLVTGSSGHLGEAVVRTLRERGESVRGLDVTPSPYTDRIASVADRAALTDAMSGVEHVLHTATLHKPHVGTHPRQDFLEVNVAGTLAVLEVAAAAGVRSVVFTSSTSAFGRALTPARGAPAAWITEDVAHRVRNIYGATETAAEDLCELVATVPGLPVIVLRTARFFPEPDDDERTRATYPDPNVKLNEFCYRRVDLADVVEAHLQAAYRAPEIGFGRYIVSATTPFTRDDLIELGRDAPRVLRRRAPALAERYEQWGWRMFPTIDRVYVNDRARRDLDWHPRHNVDTAAQAVAADGDPLGAVARSVGAKGYHDTPTGIYTR